MNSKVIGSIILVMALTAGILFYVNSQVGSLQFLSGSSSPEKSEEYLRCELLVSEIEKAESCEQKWSQFQQQFNGCESFAPSEPSEEQLESKTFRDVILDVGGCFSREGKKELALQVYARGLLFEDWMIEDHFNSYSAHFLIKRARDLAQATNNPVCLDKKGFQKQIQKFVATKNSADIKTTLYSEDILDTQVMASDAGGYLTYTQWKEVFEDSSPQYKLKYFKEIEQDCHLTTGWDADYPWRAFCAEKLGGDQCYYLTTIYAGIEATMEDFELFKKSSTPALETSGD